MDKISTKYLNSLLKYLNTFEIGQRRPAVSSQFETTIKAIKYVNRLIEGTPFINFLDLGCGAGNVLFIAKEILGEDNKYVGIDNNQTYLDAAKFINSNFHLINTDLSSSSAKRIMSNANIIYCYTPLPIYRDMVNLYDIITKFANDTAYFICNDENKESMSGFKKLKTFKGVDCCNQTVITIYKKLNNGI